MKIEPKQIRTIIVDGRQYTYVVAERPSDIELRIYQTKQQLLFRLRLPYPASWAIELHQPRAVAFIIRHYQAHYAGKSVSLAWQDDPVLFDGLLDLFFSEKEQSERADFLARLSTKPE